MGQFDLNLSTRPFKPYRAANLGLTLLLLVLIAVSVLQVYSYRQYSVLAANIRVNESKAREQTDLLSRQLQVLNAKMNSGNATAKLSEVEFLNQLLVRKSFSWTRVFSSLEKVMPANVRLISLRPFFDENGRVGFNMNIRGRSLEDATEFLRRLEDSQTFTDVALAVEEKKEALPLGGEVEFTLSAYYSPEKSDE